MAPEKSPAFQLYVKEWRSSRAVNRMSFAQRGMYLEMLLEQWESFSLPDDPAACADIIGGTVQEWTREWPALRRKFADRRSRARGDQHDDHGAHKRIVNLKLEEIRRDQKRFRKVARRGGLARASAAKRDKDGTYYPAGTPAAIQPPSSQVAPAVSSTASASASATASPSATASAVLPMRPKGGRPLAGYRKLRIWTWMVEECIALLGEHLDGFDFDGWLSDLDQGPIVVPDTWPWLKQQLVAECRHRGLPIAEAPIEEQCGKQTNRLVASLAHLRDTR